MLNARNIRTKRPTKKLSPKLYGPFKVQAKIGSHAYRLELQARWRIHNVFHGSLLESYRPNRIEGRNQIRPEPEEIEGEIEYEVEKIIRSEIWTQKVRNRSTRILYYLVKWKGYPDDECTWEPGAHLTTASEIVERFHQENPKMPHLGKGTTKTRWKNKLVGSQTPQGSLFKYSNGPRTNLGEEEASVRSMDVPGSKYTLISQTRDTSIKMYRDIN